MQDAAILSAADDGVVRRETGTQAIKLVQDLPFELIFEHARAALFHRTGMCHGADLTGAAHNSNFFC
ncbi:hypothetical protein D3C78_1839900 [compost metagenome]